MRANRQARVADRPEPHPPQADDRVADGLTHVAHLPGAPFVQHDRDHRLILPRAKRRLDQPHRGRCGPAPVDRHTPAQPIERRLVGHAADAHVVFPFHLVTRVEQPFGQRTVVGQQQQALGVVVEPPHRIDVLADVRQQIEDRRPALRVLPRRDVPARLVEQDIAVMGDDPDPLAIDADVVVPGIGLRAELQHRLAVDTDAALCDQALGGAARRDACGRQDLLQSFHHCLSSSAKNSTSFHTSRTSCCRSSSACVIKPLKRALTGTLPLKYRSSHSVSIDGITVSSVPWSR